VFLVEPTCGKMKKYCMQLNRIVRFCMQYNGGRITGMILGSWFRASYFNMCKYNIYNEMQLYLVVNIYT
jgi:hypothetical protein